MEGADGGAQVWMRIQDAVVLLFDDAPVSVMVCKTRDVPVCLSGRLPIESRILVHILHVVDILSFFCMVKKRIMHFLCMA